MVNAPQDFNGSIVYTGNGVEVSYQTAQDNSSQNGGQQGNSGDNADVQGQPSVDNAGTDGANAAVSDDNANAAASDNGTNATASTDSSKSVGTTVKTADNTNIWTSLLLLVSSAAAAAGIQMRNTKMNKNKQKD